MARLYPYQYQTITPPAHTHEATDVTDFEAEKERNTYAAKTADYTMVGTDDIIYVDAASNNVNVTLPNVGTSDGKPFRIKRIDQSEFIVTILPV